MEIQANHLIPIAAFGGSIYLKAVVGDQCSAANHAFFGWCAREGASGQYLSAGTYATIAEVNSASGFLFWAVSATHSSASLPRIRITLDGSVHEFIASAAYNPSERMLVGAWMPGMATANGSSRDVAVPFGNASLGHGYGTRGNERLMAINGAYGFVTCPSGYEALTWGLPRVRFESSLKVETTTDLDPDGINAANHGGACFLVDKGVRV